MKEIDVLYKGLRFKLQEYSYDRGSYGSYHNPPEPPEFIIDKMAVADDIIWDLDKGDFDWENVPQPLLGFFNDDDDFVKACLNALQEDITDEKTERRIREEFDE